MESKEWKGTRGKAYVKLGEIKDMVKIEKSIYTIFFNNPFDANLFADALNTIQIENTMPSELLKQRNELLALLTKMDNCEHDSFFYQEAQELIKKINN